MSNSNGFTRRDALKQGAAIVAGGLGANTVQGALSAPEDSTKVLGAMPGALSERSHFEPAARIIGHTAPSGWSMTPLQDLTGIITPSDLHFERHHGGIPIIDPERYELLVHGLVEKPLKFSITDLKRFPAVSRICFIECAGNGDWVNGNKSDLPVTISAGELDGLFSVSEWTGVRLSTLFNEVGICTPSAPMEQI
ncbi:MAG: molybdopterin-dependent oxidoreductase [Gammaproteobacteria bacterium]|jgi:sulfane dehydrogenase subunit SoxC|nr:molybdopterin-dependent oxidoreductase [Gammaproteobacteria bacterium]